jgi:threonine/homoserine/homoserine lactone efflux protein
MISIESLITFILASALLGLAPGPDNLFVLMQSAIHGRRSGVLVTLGLCTGLIVHTTIVAFGVAVIFQTSALAFNLLKIIGAAYLLYLAWLAFRAKPDKLANNETAQRSGKALYRRGVIMNITNPKVSIFFLAFLPQFANPELGSLSLQIVMLGAVFIVVTFSIFCTVAFLAGTLGSLLGRSSRAQLFLNRLAGTVFCLLALKLITSDR